MPLGAGPREETMTPAETERVISHTEAILGLKIRFHDYTGAISLLAGVQRLNHTCSFCSAVKSRGQALLKRCTECDIGMVKSRLAQSTDPFIKICHAGASEMVVPLSRGGWIGGVMFAGPFVWANDAPYPASVLRQTVRAQIPPLAAAERKRLTGLAPWRTRAIVDICGLLAYRLLSSASPAESPATGQAGDYPTRIRHFLSTRFTAPDIGLGDLARHLCLSSSRAGQLVRAHFSMTFPQLLTRYRMDRARDLLANSHFTVSEVGRLTGIEDQSYFHRLFRKTAGVTPGQFRRRKQRRKPDV